MDAPEHPGGEARGAPDPAGAAGGQTDWESTSLGSRVDEIVEAVDREAAKLRHEAEEEARQVRHRAQEEARQYIEYARRESERLVAERREQIAALSDGLMARAEEVLERLDYAVPVKTGFENLVRALGETAERLAGDDITRFNEPTWERFRETTEGPVSPGPPPAQAGPPPGAPPAPPPSPPLAFSQATGEPAPPPEPPAGPSQPPAHPGQPGATGWQQLDDAQRVAIQMAAGGRTRGEVDSHLGGLPATQRAAMLDEIFGVGTPLDATVPWATPVEGSQPG